MQRHQTSRSVWLCGIAALTVAVLDLGVLPQLGAGPRRQLGPVLLLAATLLLLLLTRQARQLRTDATRIPAARTPQAPLVGQAVGGPCDGQLLLLPCTRQSVPAELWLTPRSAPTAPAEPATDQQQQRYRLDRTTATPSGPLRYRYAPCRTQPDDDRRRGTRR